ncbi:MAG TPA: hypothetical protein VJ398_02085 [Acidimicrobiia bacterium]|nr:hypothetical protein [Acidimicrobiia bacterium]
MPRKAGKWPVLAYFYFVRHDWDGALEAAVKATVARPSCDLTYGLAANDLRYLGR